jgi:hypothetical protein
VPVSGSAFRAAVPDWQRPEEPFAGAVPEVRIRFPPAVSPSLRGPADAVGQSRGCGAGRGPVWDVRKGRAGYGRTQFGPVSLTGIDAVPLLHSAQTGGNDRRPRWASEPAEYVLVVRFNLRAVCTARSSPTADRVRSDASR